MKSSYFDTKLSLFFSLVTLLSYLFLIESKAFAQDLGQGYKCVEVTIVNKKNKIVKLADAKKDIQNKIKAANKITNAKKKKAKKAALNAVKAAMDQCASGAFIIQSAEFNVEKEQCTDKQYDVNVTFLPPKAGRAISIEVSSDNGANWTAIASGSDGGSGTTALSFKAPGTAGTYLYRAHADAFPPLVAGSSGAIEAKISPCGIEVFNDPLPVIRPGAEQTCLLDGTGSAWCWGDNATGALGDGTFNDSLIAVRVSGGLKFTSLAAGAEHNCALEADGTAWCWGNNNDALQGKGALGDGTMENRNVPTRVAGGLKFKKLSAGIQHTCGIDQYNQVYCWGSNFFGQCGNGAPPVQNNSQDLLVPTRIISSKNYTDISVNGFQSCAMTADKQVDCWGDNSYSLSSGNTINFHPDVNKVVTQPGSGYSRIALGSYQRCGLLPNGGFQCWGDERDGSFGDGVTDHWGQDPINGLGGPYKYLTFGNRHGCGIVDNEDAYCWGYNLYGALGNGKGDSISENRSTPQLVTGGIKWRQVVANFGHTCGISVGGNAYCWGGNFKGQLGNGQTRQSATKAPTSVIFAP